MPLLTKVLASSVCLAWGATVAAPTYGQPVRVETAPKVTYVDGADLFRARKVLRRFLETERRPECYEVLFSPFEGNLRVDFVPKTPDPIRFEGQPDDPNEPKVCGRNVGYVIDGDGKVLRRIFSR